MRASVTVSAGLLAALLLPAAALAHPAGLSREQDRAYMPVFGATQPPYGFVMFCKRVPGECAQGVLQDDQRFDAEPQRLTELDAVNRAVNREIEPATDLEIYGQTEYWTIPTTKGDCEDFALLKRKRLIALGWPGNALLMTVVRDEKGEGHAVLTARTVQGDFILDNKTDEVKVWYRTHYEFVMRQSYLDPRLWMSLDPREASSALPSAGFRRGR